MLLLLSFEAKKERRRKRPTFGRRRSKRSKLFLLSEKVIEKKVIDEKVVKLKTPKYQHRRVFNDKKLLRLRLQPKKFARLELSKMMNSYFSDHSSGFYNPSAAAAEAHQAAYRSFSQSLSLVPPTSQTNPYQTNRGNNSTGGPSDSTNNYVDAACKSLYDTNGGSTQTSSAFKAECSLNNKDQTNGFKTPDQMSTSSWNTSALRPSSSSMTGSMASGFEAAARSADAWSACCQPNPGAPGSLPPGASSFYPWMAIAGEFFLLKYCILTASLVTVIYFWKRRVIKIRTNN